MDQTELVNVFGLARRLQLPPNWLEHEARRGAIPCLAVENQLRFNVEAVRHALARRAAGDFVRRDEE